MGGVARAGGVVDKKWFVRRHGVLHAQPSDGMVRHELIKVRRVVAALLFGFQGPGILVDRRMPLVGIAAEEAVKVFEAEPRRPEIKRASLAGVPVWDIVVLTVPGSIVPM